MQPTVRRSVRWSICRSVYWSVVIESNSVKTVICASISIVWEYGGGVGVECPCPPVRNDIVTPRHLNYPPPLPWLPIYALPLVSSLLLFRVICGVCGTNLLFSHQLRQNSTFSFFPPPPRPRSIFVLCTFSVWLVLLFRPVPSSFLFLRHMIYYGRLRLVFLV